MGPETVLEIGHQALWVTVLLATPLLVSALAIGVLIGMLQAATQINEMTLSFIPKLAVLALSLFIFGAWMLTVIMDFTRRLITSIPMLIG